MKKVKPAFQTILYYFLKIIVGSARWTLGNLKPFFSKVAIDPFFCSFPSFWPDLRAFNRRVASRKKRVISSSNPSWWCYFISWFGPSGKNPFWLYSTWRWHASVDRQSTISDLRCQGIYPSMKFAILVKNFLSSVLEKPFYTAHELVAPPLRSAMV
mgnify:CR=1 FL=1